MKDHPRIAPLLAMLAVIGSFVPVVAKAQYWGPPPTQDRSQRWEFYGGPRFTLGETIDFDGGSMLITEDEVGLGFGFAWNFDAHLQLGGDFSWNSVEYDATIVDADSPGNSAALSGELDTSSMNFVVGWNFLPGPLTPYANASLGWTWIDSNIVSGVGNGCWWDPWWGYICGPYASTYGDDEFSYGVGAGLRWDIGPSLFARFGYDHSWIDISNATGTPDFGSIRLEFGGKY